MFPCSSNEVKCGAKFRQSTRKASRIQRNGTILMGTKCLNTCFKFPLPALCYAEYNVKLKNTVSDKIKGYKNYFPLLYSVIIQLSHVLIL